MMLENTLYLIFVAVASGHLMGAALDVFETESLPSDSALMRCEKLILTPHIVYLSTIPIARYLERLWNKRPKFFKVCGLHTLSTSLIDLCR